MRCAQTPCAALRLRALRSDSVRCAQTPCAALRLRALRSDSVRCAQTPCAALRLRALRSDSVRCAQTPCAAELAALRLSVSQVLIFECESAFTSKCVGSTLLTAVAQIIILLEE